MPFSREEAISQSQNEWLVDSPTDQKISESMQIEENVLI